MALGRDGRAALGCGCEPDSIKPVIIGADLAHSGGKTCWSCAFSYVMGVLCVEDVLGAQSGGGGGSTAHQAWYLSRNVPKMSGRGKFLGGMSRNWDDLDNPKNDYLYRASLKLAP